jgi:hypothetical protein
MGVLIRSNLSVYLHCYLGAGLPVGILAGTFYTLLGVLLWVLLCLCLGVLLFLVWRVGSLVARDCLRDLTFVRRIYNSRARGCCCVVPKELSDGV